MDKDIYNKCSYYQQLGKIQNFKISNSKNEDNKIEAIRS